MPENEQQKPSRDIGKLPLDAEAQRAADEAAAKQLEQDRKDAEAAKQEKAAAAESEQPQETEVSRLKRENVDVDKVEQEADIKVALTEGNEKVCSIDIATGNYDFESENPQYVTAGAAALLVETGYVEVVS